MIKEALNLLYCDRCDIYEYEGIEDDVTHQTEAVRVKTYEDLPCRISFKRGEACEIKDGAGMVGQNVVLFLNPEIEICEGSCVAVRRNNGVDVVFYRAAGKPFVYTSHKEVSLVNEEVRS